MAVTHPTGTVSYTHLDVYKRQLRNQPKWEVELAIVNFRYAPQGLAPQQQDKRSMVISQRMVEAGFACVLTAQLKGRTCLLYTSRCV